MKLIELVTVQEKQQTTHKKNKLNHLLLFTSDGAHDLIAYYTHV